MRLRQSVISTTSARVQALDMNGTPLGPAVDASFAYLDSAFIVDDAGVFSGWVHNRPVYDFSFTLSRRDTRRLLRTFGYHVPPVPAKAAHRRKYGR